MRRRPLVPASLWVRAARLAAFALASYSAGTALAASPIGARSFRTPHRNTQKQTQDDFAVLPLFYPFNFPDTLAALLQRRITVKPVGTDFIKMANHFYAAFYAAIEQYFFTFLLKISIISYI